MLGVAGYDQTNDAAFRRTTPDASPITVIQEVEVARNASV
jgi:hypothetical protein